MFNSPDFIWKGKKSKDFFIKILREDTDILHDLGIPYSKDLSHDEGVWTEKESDAFEFTISLWMCKDSIPIAWTSDRFKRVKDWLISDSFCEFQSYDNLDYSYRLKVTKIQKRLNHKGYGCIDVTFKSMSNYAYKKEVVKEMITKTQLIDIHHTTDEIYEPYIVITHLGTKDGIIRINDMIITDIEHNETIYIDNKMTSIVNDFNENRLMNCNRKWIELKPGDNQILIEGNCLLEIICKFPMVI